MFHANPATLTERGRVRLAHRGRNSDNTLIYDKLNWHPQVSLEEGMKRTYDWIEHQVRQTQPVASAAPRAAAR